MTFVDDFRKTFDAAEFCKTVKAGVGEGRITSTVALRDSAAVTAAGKCLQDFANFASAPIGPDVVAAYVTYSNGASEIFTALRAISVSVELVSAALECLTCIVKYSLNGSNPESALQEARSVVKEIVKSRAVLFYDILAVEGKACAKKALNLLRLVATCHPMLAKELVNRFDLASKSMAPSLCSITNNHCRIPFLDLMFVLIASGERDILHYFAAKGREVVVTCLRTIQGRAVLEANGGVGSSTKAILWKQGKAHHKKQSKVLPSHVQKRELVAAINFLLALEKHVFIGFSKSSSGATAHPVPALLAALAATEIPPIDVAPREVLQEHEALRSTASRIFVSIAKHSQRSAPVDIIRALNNPSFNFGTETVVKFISNVINEKPEIATHLLKAGRLLSAPPALTVRWFGYFSVIAASVLRLSSPIPTFREKQFFEKCFSHPDPLIRHLGSVLAISFCKVVESKKTTQEHISDFLPPFEVIQRMVKPASSDNDVFHRLIASYQSLLQHRVVGTDVKLMIFSVDTAGEDVMGAARTIEAALRTAPYTGVRKVVHKGYLSKLITGASQTPRYRDAVKLWSVCSTTLRCTDLFQPGTHAEIDIYLSVLSSLGKEAEEPAKAFEAIIAQALEMPYGLYDRLHSDEWSEESATIKTSHLAVATMIKLQKLAQRRSCRDGCESDSLSEKTLQRMLLSVVATSSLLHCEDKPNSYLAALLPSALSPKHTWWNKQLTEEGGTGSSNEHRQIVRELLLDRGNYPKTKFLRLLEALNEFDRSMNVMNREDVTHKARSELGLAWDSWCDYWLSYGKSSHANLSSNGPMSWGSSKEGTTFIFRGLVRLLLDVSYEDLVEVESENDLHVLKKVLGPSDYRFATALMLKTVEDVGLQDQLHNESLLQMSDMLSQTIQREEAEFFYDTVLHSVAEGSRWTALQVHKMLTFCTLVLSKWESLPEWEMHVTHSAALLKTLLSHFSTRIAARSRVFLAARTLDSLPPLTKLTNDTVNDLLIVVEHSPHLRGLAVAQVYDWSEKEYRSCNGALFQLLNIALHHTDDTDDTKKISQRSVGLLESFVKGSLKSKSVWVLNGLREDNGDSAHALKSIGRMIARTRRLCEFFLHRLFRAGSFTRISWVLLGAILESFKLGTEPEVTNEELTKLLSLIAKYMDSISRVTDESPDHFCLQVVEIVARLLRQRNFSLYGPTSSLDQDVTSLSKSLRDCIQSRSTVLFLDSSLCADGLSSEGRADHDYFASLLAGQAEILRLDLSLESQAKEALAGLCSNDGRFLRYCLRTNEAGITKDDIFQRKRDLGIHFVSMLKSALLWLPQAACDHDLVKSLLCIETIMSSQMAKNASGRSETHSSFRECIRIISHYIRANSLQRRFPALLESKLSAGTEAGSTLNWFPKPLLEEAADYILQDSYHGKDIHGVSDTCKAENLDPVFVLNTFMHGCRQALIQPQAPVLDLHRIAKDGLLALAITGTASANQDLRVLSFACLEAFATVVGPASGVPPGSASGLYKDRKQLAFLLELFRNSISDPLTQVLPLFAVWFRTATRVALSPGHPTNKLVSTFLLRTPCLEVSDCYGLSHFLNCEASGAELQAIRVTAFDIIQQGVHSQRDISVLRRRRIFDKVFMFAASAVGFHSSIRSGALRSLHAMLNRDESLDITEELVGGHGMIIWLASDAKQIGETMEELFVKLSIIQSAAESFFRRKMEVYASILAEALTLFTISRTTPAMTTGPELQVAERIVECGASIARISPKKRYLFRIDFADLWIQYKSKKVATFQTKLNFTRCVCRQQDTVRCPDILEMVLEHTIYMCESKNRMTANVHSWSDDLLMAHMYVAECLLAMRHEATKAALITTELCNLLAMSLHIKSTIWLILAAVTALDLCGRLNDKVMAYTDKIPAFVPSELKPLVEQQFCSVVDEMRVIIVDELLALGDDLNHKPPKTNAIHDVTEAFHRTNGVH